MRATRIAACPKPAGAVLWDFLFPPSTHRRRRADALSGLSRLTHLGLASNRLKTPLLDLSRLSALQALHLGGNPLTYIPELSHATALRTLSLAAICITADEAYTAIRVTLPKRGMAMNLRAPRCPVPDDLLALLLDRSSCQHPLLAGGLAELSRDVEVRAALLRMDHALPQIVLLACSQQPVVAARACETLRLLAEVADAAARLERASAKDAIHSAVRSPSQPVQLAALQVRRRRALCATARRRLAAWSQERSVPCSCCKRSRWRPTTWRAACSPTTPSRRCSSSWSTAAPT